MSKVTYCRWAPSLGDLEGTALETWGTSTYSFWKHRKEPTVFFGLYDLRDYLSLWLHQGKKWVLWAGSDARNLQQGFLFNDGKLGWLSKAFKMRFKRLILHILSGAEHWVENAWEAQILRQEGLLSRVCPSYMGNVDLPICYQPPKGVCHVYLSASEGRQEEYGWGIIERIANWLPFHVFHLYGASWITRHQNVVVHGRVSKEEMNRETEDFQIGLRLNETDGFSEIMAKAVLQGQYAIGKVKHPRIPSFENDADVIIKLNALAKKKTPNEDTRAYYRANLNRYPWNICERSS